LSLDLAINIKILLARDNPSGHDSGTATPHLPPDCRRFSPRLFVTAPRELADLLLEIAS
jgi:hypothetical protein